MWGAIRGGAPQDEGAWRDLGNVNEMVGLLGFVQIFAVNSSEFVFIMQGLLDFVVLIFVIPLIHQSQTKFQYQNCHRTLCSI